MGRRRRGPFHGVEMNRRATDGSGDPRASEILIRRICIHYEDGWKVCFIPEAGEEFFSRDDVHRVVGMLHTGSEELEWGLSEPGRQPGEGPYDTGAV